MYPTFYGSSGAAFVDGQCKWCGLVVRSPAHYRPKWAARRQPAQGEPPARAFDVDRAPPVDHGMEATSAEIVFDALCHEQFGSFSSFERLALQVEQSRLFVDQFLRALESLAHIEVERDLRTMAPRAWSVSPPVLADDGSGKFVLVGWRSRLLLSELRSAAERLGGEIELREQGFAPPRVRVVGVAAERMEALAADVARVVGRGLTIVRQPRENVVLALPRLSELVSALPRHQLSSYRSLQRWDGERARWADADNAALAGAYRLQGAVTSYVLRDVEDLGEGTMRKVDPRLAKHLAALAAGEPLVGFDAESETLYVPLGAELPGLFERAVVAIPGLSPTADEERRLTCYRAVPQDIASQVVGALTS